MKSRGVSLPREVYKWLQSLDLSAPIRHATRDFENGFLVAEICSRYYPNEIYVNLYYSGSGARQRKDNWIQLQTFFQKHSIPVDPLMVSQIADGLSDSAAVVLQLYTIFTHKNLQRPLISSVVPKIRKGGHVSIVNPELLNSDNYIACDESKDEPLADSLNEHSEAPSRKLVGGGSKRALLPDFLKSGLAASYGSQARLNSSQGAQKNMSKPHTSPSASLSSSVAKKIIFNRK